MVYIQMSHEQLNQEEGGEQANLAMSSMPSFQSGNSLAAEEGEGEELQVVQNKSDRRINHEEILKMFNEQLEKEEREREEVELRRRESVKNRGKAAPKPPLKRASQEERRGSKEATSERLQALSEKSGRLKRRIEESCRQYKSLYRPSLYDTKMQRFRFECKEKLFFYLCFGLEELRDLPREDLWPGEEEVVGRDAFETVRRLAFEVDLEMVRLLNKGDRQEVSREYRQQFDSLLNNLKDENNHELKRKILSRTLPPPKIALASQIEFFTAAKREEILEKQKRYIAEFTVENVLQPFNEQEREEITERPLESEGPREEAPSLRAAKSGVTNKYLEESAVLQLEELLSESQLGKMLRRLEEDLQGRSRTALIANFHLVFGL